jgi:capsular exopolysaccharide synthesis family protein
MNVPQVIPQSNGAGPEEPKMGTEQRAADQGGMTPLLLQYWQAALRWKWIIAGIVLAFLGAGLVWTLLTPARFTARSEIEVTRQQKQITNVEGLESSSAGQDLEFYATQYALVKARPVAERVARELRLASDPTFFEAHGLDPDAIDQEFPNLSRMERQQKQERLVVRTLLKTVSISPVRTSRLIDISYTSQSPEVSARIANAWGQAFIAVSMDREFASTADARRFLEERLGALRGKLEQSERAVVNYASQNGIITLESRDGNGNSGSSRTLVGADLNDLNSQLNLAVAARIAAQSRLEPNGDATTEAVSNEGLAALRRERAQVAAEYQRQLVIFEPDYPAVQQLARQLQSLDTAVARETGRISSSRRSEYGEALKREASLRNKVETLKAALDRQQRSSIQYAIFQREADTNRQLYDALLQRYKEIGVAGTVGASNISIVEDAQVPPRPSGPNLLANLLLSLLAGALVAGGVVFALEHVDEGIRDPAQVQPTLGLPLLGHTPTVEGDVLEHLRDIKSMYYESYFSIETSLSFATNHGFPRSMTVTSTQPTEGKSSTALALAAVLGRTGKRVLLVDGDMRSPSIHSMVERENNVGFSNYLAGDDVWSHLLQDTDYLGVQVISAGPPPPSAAELLSSGRLQQFISESRQRFDHIIIDSPPVLGLSDAPLLARAVEGCVFVVRSETSTVRAIRNSLSRLKQIDAHIFGVVLTQLSQRQGAYGYGYGYGYGRRYGDEALAVEA